MNDIKPSVWCFSMTTLLILIAGVAVFTDLVAQDNIAGVLMLTSLSAASTLFAGIGFAMDGD